MDNLTLECSPLSSSAAKDDCLSEFSFSDFELESLTIELLRRLEDGCLGGLVTLSTAAEPTDLSSTCLLAFFFSSVLGITGITGTTIRRG